tara:strand:- start:1127 stop:1885 length:759 start_codon:yes stop_codon:yes gene_type:complete
MIFTNLIETNLRTKVFGKNIEYYQRLESTNAESWSLIKKDMANHGTIIITDNQIKGKGRNGNTWFMSPSKGLAMSIILLEPLQIKDAERIPIAAGVAAAKTLENRGVNASLKWPNDIMINEKKCGGILCESKILNQNIQSMVVGIGININENKYDFPPEILETATSLFIETGYSHQRELLCAIFTTFFERELNNLSLTLDLWKNYCSHIGQIISFNHKGEKYSGTFKGIDSNGGALIEIENDIKNFTSIIMD